METVRPYQAPEAEVCAFTQEDTLTTSGEGDLGSLLGVNYGVSGDET